MQDCCKTAPRRARYWVIAAIVALAVIAALAGGSPEPTPPGPRSDRQAR